MMTTSLMESVKILPLDLVLLAVRLPLVVGAHLGEGELEGGREGNDDGAGVVLVHVLLDLEQPANKRGHSERRFCRVQEIQASGFTKVSKYWTKGVCEQGGLE